MTRHILIAGLVVLLGSAGVSASDTAGTATDSSGILKGGEAFPGQFRPLTLKGEGQLDLANATVTFDGEASHVGRFTATGVYTAIPLQVRGTISVTPGDSLNFVLYFVGTGDIHGTRTWGIETCGGSGRFANTRSAARGPITVNDDDSFTFDLDGSIWYFYAGPPHLSEPCL